MNLLSLRFVLAIASLFSICLFVAAVIFFGRGLDEMQKSLLLLLAAALIAEAKSASSWVFDGVAPKDEPADPGTVTTSTTETTTKAPVQPSAPEPLPAYPPAAPGIT